MMFKKVFIFLLAGIVLFTVACSSEKDNQIVKDAYADEIFILNDIGIGEIVLTSPGTYTANNTGIYDGNIIIKSTGITIKDTEINGDITLHEDIGEGDAYLENVIVKGSTYVYGGGINSVHCRLVFMPYLYIKKPTSNVRIAVEEDTKITEVVATSSTIIDIKDDTSNIDNLKIETMESDSEINIRGNIKNVDVISQCNIIVDEEGSIDNINIEKDAKGTSISGEGKILTAVINAEDVNIFTKVDDIYSTNDIDEVTVAGKKVLLNDKLSGNQNDDFKDSQEGNSNNDDSKENDESSFNNDDDYVTDNDSNDDIEKNDDSKLEEEKNNDNIKYSFIKASSDFSNDNKSFTLTVVLSKPSKVYYVYEDISLMFGSSYSPSNVQIINGYNCFGQPNPKPFVKMEDDGEMSEQEFPSEAMIAGFINVTEANKEFTVLNNEPTLKIDDGQAPELNSNVNLHIVAVDWDGNQIRISPTIIDK